MKFKQYKQFWFLLIKFSIVFGAGFFIYKRLDSNELWQSEALFNQLKSLFSSHSIALFLLLIMTLINWFFEIIKWHTLVNSVQDITFYQAFIQSLSSHTLSLITPFKAGEYGGKVLYFPKYLRNKVLGLNLVGNFTQLLITLIFGILGLVYFFSHFNIPINPHKIRRIGYFIAFGILAVFSGQKLKRNSYYQRIFSFFRNLKQTLKYKVLFFSLIRYLVFSHQFYLLLVVFGTDITYLTAMMLIFSMYFLATMLPVISLFDFIIKGSIAIYLFSFVPVNEMTILLISTILWLLNFALPAIVGSYFVLIFKPKFAPTIKQR